MSREYEGWDSPTRSRDTDSNPRLNRRRGSGRADDGRQAGDYGSDPYAAPEGYGTDGYGDQGGYGQEQYANGYADQSYGGGYADDGYGQDPYASRDPYGTGDYGQADPYSGTDPRASGPYGAPDPYQRSRDPYDTGGGGYAAEDGFAGHDPYASPAGSGYDEYGWQDPSAHGAGDDPGLTRRRRAAMEGELDAEDPRHDGFFRGFGGGDDDLVGHGRPRSRPPSRGRPPRQRKSHAGLIALFVVLVIFGGIAGVGYKYYHEYQTRHATYTGSGFGHVLITVQPGDTLDGISSQLLHKHVIAAIDPWASYVANKSGLHPGKYRIHLHMSPAAAYAALTDVKNLVNSKVTIPDGMRLTDILPLLARESGFPLSQFQSAIKDTAALGLPAYAHNNPEGFLYPDTYSIAPGEKPLEILQTAVKEFNTQAAAIHLQAAAASVHFTPAQVIIGASILEAEAGPKYFGQVARVIDNRLNAVPEIPLGMDSTIAYVVHKHTDQLTQTDLNVNSPYNTRVHTGLPPGPIGSPDVAAIQAFLHPPHGPWLFFVTVDKKGTTLFTDSMTQFNAWVAESKRNGV